MIRHSGHPVLIFNLKKTVDTGFSPGNGENNPFITIAAAIKGNTGDPCPDRQGLAILFLKNVSLNGPEGYPEPG
jgi:hypothetical protein